MIGVWAQVAAVLDSPAVQGAAGASPHGPSNPVVVKNPVPGFIGQLFQLFFNTPKWVQWGGIVLGAVVGLIVLWQLYLRRETISAWLAAQSRGYKAGLAGVAGVMLLSAGGVGYAGNHYMQHNNDFCVGCHVMGDAWGAFQRSEHRKLECHDCHRQSMFASARQLYFWIAEKPQDIPKHAKVPTAICSECHVKSEADSGWKRIIATAGHRLHMKSDSAALAKIACVTCHGAEVHRFKPVDQTCGQSGCHATKDTEIRLGAMAGQTSQHCTGCHTFTRPVPENLSMDSTRKFLVANGSPQSCFGCHEMKAKLKGFEAKDDRGHNGVCGSCHNPHKQTEPKQAYESCASSGCHFDLGKKSAFHVGLKAHANAPCGQCHEPHAWQPISKTCEGCHKSTPSGKLSSPPRISMPPRSRASGAAELEPDAPQARAILRPIARSRVLPSRTQHVRRATHRGRRAAAVRHLRSPTLRLVARQSGASPAPPAAKPTQTRASPKDSPAFSHGKHKLLACGGCHDQKNAPGVIKVRGTADCAACHHATDRPISCEGCHNSRSASITKTFNALVSMRVNGEAAAKPRMLPFAHREHRDLECKGCHTDGVLLKVKRDCQSCHSEHHTAERTCLTCHQPLKTAHARSAHDGCAGSGCHSNTAVLALPPSRSTCLVCHAEQRTHKPKRECAECHAVTWSRTASSSK